MGRRVKTGKYLTGEERMKILADVMLVHAFDIDAARERARAAGVSWATIRNWMRRLAEGGTLADRNPGRPTSEVVRRLDDLEERVGSLEDDVRGPR